MMPDIPLAAATVTAGARCSRCAHRLRLCDRAAQLRFWPDEGLLGALWDDVEAEGSACC